MTKSVFIEKRHRITPILNAHHLFVRENEAFKGLFILDIKKKILKYPLFFKNTPFGAARQDLCGYTEIYTTRSRSSRRTKETSTMWWGWYLFFASRRPGTPMSLSLLMKGYLSSRNAAVSWLMAL